MNRSTTEERLPGGSPHMWVSERMEEGRPEWLELEWTAPVAVSEVHLTFNDDVNEDLINLHHHETPFIVIPELVRDYDVEARIGGEWRTLAVEQGNRKRKRVHRLPQTVEAEAIRLIVRRTNGGERAELVEMRVY